MKNLVESLTSEGSGMETEDTDMEDIAAVSGLMDTDGEETAAGGKKRWGKKEKKKAKKEKNSSEKGP